MAAATSSSGGASWSSMPSSAPISLHYQPQRFAAHYPTYHHPQPMPPYHQLEASARPSFSPTTTSYPRASYDLTPTAEVDRGYTSHLPPSPKKGSRSKLYPSEEARVAAKLVQKAKRREQNRNAQRRLRDRKEEHIFKLEGEVAELRRDAEERRGLEEMVRRLVEERDDLRRRLDELTPPRGLGLIETGGYSSSGGEGERESKESSVSSASIGTPRSPNSPPSRMGSMPLTPRTATFPTMGKGSPTQLTLPRIKMSDSTLPDSMMPAGLLPPVSAFQWNLH